MLQTLGVPKYDWIPAAAWNADFGEFYMLYGGIVLVFNTIERYIVQSRLSSTSCTNSHSARNVMSARRARGEQARVALLGLIPFFASWALIASYLLLQPTILHNHLVPFVFFVGLVNAYSVGQIITAHLVILDFPYQNVIVLPLLYGIVDSLGPVLKDHIGLGWPSALGEDVYQVAFMFLCLGWAVGVYGSFVVDVIVTICDYLGESLWAPLSGFRSQELTRVRDRYLLLDNQASSHREGRCEGGGTEEEEIEVSQRNLCLIVLPAILVLFLLLSKICIALNSSIS